MRLVNKLFLGEAAGPAHVAFTPDGSRALVSRGDKRVSILAVSGTVVTLDKRELAAGLRPYSFDISADGAFAVVGNLGMGQGDVDTISLIDLLANPPRVVDTVSVGQTPEGVFFSPSGNIVGITVVGGSNKPKNSPFNGLGNYRQFIIDGGRLRPLRELRGGEWLQGHAFSSEGQSVIVQDAVNRELRLYTIQGQNLTDTGERLRFEGAPSTLVRWR